MSEAVAVQESGIGHNRAPESAFDKIKERTEKCVDVANRWANERPEIKTEDEAEKAADFLRQLRGLVSGKNAELDVARMAENKPHQDTINATNARYAPLKRKAEIALELIRKLQSAWLIAKQAKIDAETRKAAEEAEAKRKAAEEAARKAQEETGGDVIGRTFEAEQAQQEADEAARVAAVAAKTTAKTGSAYGAKAVSLRTRLVIEIHDVTKIPARTLKKLCDKPYVREELMRALREEIEITRALPDEAVTVKEEQYAV